MTTCVTDFASKPATVWRSQLASLKRSGMAEHNSRVRECREALAFWKVRSAIDVAKHDLSPQAVDQLVPTLLGLSR